MQRQLGEAVGVEVDYVYNGGRNERYERNQNLSYNPATGANYPFSDVSRRPFPDWGLVGAVFHDGWSNYHGLQTNVTKRLEQPVAGVGQLSALVASRRARRADHRVRGRLVPGGARPGRRVHAGRRRSAAPRGRERHRGLPYGFQASGLYFFGSGQRFVTSWGGDLRGVGAAGREPTARRMARSCRGTTSSATPIHRMDVRLQKRFPLGGRVGIDGILEVFNVFNHANFGGYATEESSSNYGQPAQNANVAYAPRMVQLGFRMSF